MKNYVEEGGVGRHETFTPRYGWLKKGFEKAKEDPSVFSASDAVERLGVGKNMVSSIRFWCLAFHILEYQSGEERKGHKGALSPTEFATDLLDNGGWDPYLEDPASLWLLHWQLFIPPMQAASWPIIFNHVRLPLFDLKQLSHSLIFAAQEYPKLTSLSSGSFEKDASCLIRMYATISSSSSFEIESPFSQLGFIQMTEIPNTYRFDISEKPSLPSLIFASACFSYAYHTQPKQRTISLHKLVYDYNSPGVAFKISETIAGRLLDHAATFLPGVDFIESMGYRQLQFERDPDYYYKNAMKKYYKSMGR